MMMFKKERLLLSSQCLHVEQALSRFMATLNCPVNHVSMAHYVVAATASL